MPDNKCYFIIDELGFPAPDSYVGLAYIDCFACEGVAPPTPTPTITITPTPTPTPESGIFGTIDVAYVGEEYTPEAKGVVYDITVTGNNIEIFHEITVYPVEGGEYTYRDGILYAPDDFDNYQRRSGVNWINAYPCERGGTGIIRLIAIEQSSMQEYILDTDTFVMTTSQTIYPGRWAFVGNEYTRFGYSRGNNNDGDINHDTWVPDENWNIRVFEYDIIQNYLKITLRRLGSHPEPSTFNTVDITEIPFSGNFGEFSFSYASIDEKIVNYNSSDGYTYVSYKWNYSSDVFNQDSGQIRLFYT